MAKQRVYTQDEVKLLVNWVGELEGSDQDHKTLQLLASMPISDYDFYCDWRESFVARKQK